MKILGSDIAESDLNEYSSSNDSNQYVELIVEEEDLSSNSKYLKSVLSILTGIGTGLAMMPIFNKEVRELEQFGIDIHESILPYTLSTINTLVVYSYIASSNIYSCINELPLLDIENISETKSFLLDFSKIISVFTALIPVAQLWEIELHNKELSNSAGFDKFIAWGLFTSIPLVAYYTIKSYTGFKKMILCPAEENILLNSVGSKCCVYGLTGLALIGNEIVYLNSVDSLYSNEVIPNQIMKDFVKCIGFTSAILMTSIEYKALKQLFKEDQTELSCKRQAKGMIAAIESGWFTLPTVSLGMTLTQGWNIFAKGATFCGLFIANTVLEAKNFFKNK